MLEKLFASNIDTVCCVYFQQSSQYYSFGKFLVKFQLKIVNWNRLRRYFLKITVLLLSSFQNLSFPLQYTNQNQTRQPSQQASPKPPNMKWSSINTRLLQVSRAYHSEFATVQSFRLTDSGRGMSLTETTGKTSAKRKTNLAYFQNKNDDYSRRHHEISTSNRTSWLLRNVINRKKYKNQSHAFPGIRRKK